MQRALRLLDRIVNTVPVNWMLVRAALNTPKAVKFKMKIPPFFCEPVRRVVSFRAVHTTRGKEKKKWNLPRQLDAAIVESTVRPSKRVCKQQILILSF